MATAIGIAIARNSSNTSIGRIARCQHGQAFQGRRSCSAKQLAATTRFRTAVGNFGNTDTAAVSCK